MNKTEKQITDELFSNEFCTHEISLKLKELGFNQRCFAFYNEKEELVLQDKPYAFWTSNDNINWNRQIFRFKSDRKNLCSAPLLQQAITWLDTKNWYVDVEMYITYDGLYAFKYHIKDSMDFKEHVYATKNEFPTRYKCTIAAISKALELCKG